MRPFALAAVAFVLLAGCTDPPSGPTIADAPEGYILEPLSDLDIRKGKTNPAVFPSVPADPDVTAEDALGGGGPGLPTPAGFTSYTYIAESTLGAPIADDQRIIVSQFDFADASDATAWADGVTQRQLERAGMDGCLTALMFSDGARVVLVRGEPEARDGGARAAGDALGHFEALREAMDGSATCAVEGMEAAHTAVARYAAMEKPNVDDHEPNDAMAQATTYPQPRQVSGSLPAGDVDWFGFDLTQATPTTFFAAGNVHVQVATADGTVVGEGTASPKTPDALPTVDLCILVDPGTYYMRVAPAMDPVVEFTLAISPHGGCDP